MAKGYAVVTYRKITNQEKWAAYAKIASVVPPKLGGGCIIRGLPAAERDFRLVEGVA